MDKEEEFWNGWGHAFPLSVIWLFLFVNNYFFFILWRRGHGKWMAFFSRIKMDWLNEFVSCANNKRLMRALRKILLKSGIAAFLRNNFKFDVFINLGTKYQCCVWIFFNAKILYFSYFRIMKWSNLQCR